MKQYELTILTRVNDEGVLEDIEKTIARHKFIIQDLKHEGKKRLAYPIEGETEAYYTMYYLKTDENTEVSPLTNNLETNPEIIRYLLVSVKPKENNK